MAFLEALVMPETTELESLYEQEGLESKRQQVNEVIARLEPDNLRALSFLGKQQFAEQLFAQAQQTWEHVLRQDPTWAEGYFYLGGVLAERGDVEPALTAYERALSLLINAPPGLSEEGMPDTAGASGGPVRIPPQGAALVKVWEQALTAGAHHERALASFWEARHRLAHQFVTQGRQHLQRDDAEAAMAHLCWVRALNPMDDTARALLKQAQTSLTFDRGVRSYQAQEYVGAIRWFRETLALDPEHEKAKRHLRYAQQCLEGGLSERLRHLDLGEREKC
jgi:tetratricopeptide (TPR) repeat protein